MEYWLCVIDELADQTGIVIPDDKRETAAGILKSAASVHGDYSTHHEPSRPPEAPARPAERKRAWWEDLSTLSGSDWVLAQQIHRLIGSRYT